jgi:hypothetical protein
MPMNSAIGFPSASDALGLGGQLSQQVAEETEEQRKKRLGQLQQQQQLGDVGSYAVTSLFGPGGGAPRGTV